MCQELWNEMIVTNQNDIENAVLFDFKELLNYQIPLNSSSNNDSSTDNDNTDEVSPNIASLSMNEFMYPTEHILDIDKLYHDNFKSLPLDSLGIPITPAPEKGNNNPQYGSSLMRLPHPNQSNRNINCNDIITEKIIYENNGKVLTPELARKDDNPTFIALETPNSMISFVDTHSMKMNIVNHNNESELILENDETLMNDSINLNENEELTTVAVKPAPMKQKRKRKRKRREIAIDPCEFGFDFNQVIHEHRNKHSSYKKSIIESSEDGNDNNISYSQKYNLNTKLYKLSLDSSYADRCDYNMLNDDLKSEYHPSFLNKLNLSNKQVTKNRIKNPQLNRNMLDISQEYRINESLFDPEFCNNDNKSDDDAPLILDNNIPSIHDNDYMDMNAGPLNTSNISNNMESMERISLTENSNEPSIINPKTRGISNMKHLKTAMSKILNQSSILDVKNNSKKGVISFQNLCIQLKQSTSLPINEKNLLTIPNCFMSLLDLSTQNGYLLSRIPNKINVNLHDFLIFTNDLNINDIP